MLSEEQVRKRLLENTITSLKNKVEISIYVYGNQFDREAVYKWLTGFCFFKPTRMVLTRNGTYCSKRYSKSVFKEMAFDNKVSNLCLEDTKWGYLEFDSNGLTASFRVKIPLTLWIEQKVEMIDKYQEIFMELGGCFGYVVNAFDDEVIQNPRAVGVHKLFELTDADFPGVNDIPIIRKDWPTPYPMYQIDPSYLPGHKERYEMIAFTTAPYMWFGPDYVRFFSQEKLSGFENCEENIEFSVGYRRICLWHDVAEYNAPVYRERQWSFLKEIELREMVNELNSKPFMMKDADHTPDPGIEIQKGNFSHGGTLLVKFYVDKKGRECSKSAAFACIHREMRGNTIVWQEKVKL